MPFDDHSLAGLQAAQDDVASVDDAAVLDGADTDGVALLDHHHMIAEGRLAANRLLRQGRSRWCAAALLVAALLLAGAFAVELLAHRTLEPTASGYGAAVSLVVVLGGFFVVVALSMALFVVARALAGKLDAVRRVTFDNARLFAHYTVAQSLAGVVLVHGFPRLVG